MTHPPTKQPRYDQFVGILIVAALIFVLASKYNGVHIDYFTLYLFSQDPSILPNDWYIADSVLYKGSIIYDIVRLMGLPVENEIIAAFLYIIFSLVALFYCFRLFSEHFQAADRNEVLLLLLLGSFLFFKFLETTRASILGSVSAPQPTAVAHAIAFASIYYLVSGRLLIGTIATTLTIAIAVKGNFILVPIAALYILLHREIQNWKLVYLLIPMAYVLAKLSGSDETALGFDDLLRLCENAIWREGNEAALNLQSPWALALMSATFFVMPFLIKRFEDASLRYFAWSVYAVSLLEFVFGYFYTAVGYKIFPQPLLILIAPPRAMKFYTFFFAMMFFAWALRTQALVWYERVAAVLAMVVLKGSFTGIVAAAAIGAAGIALPRLVRRLSGVEPTDLPGLRQLFSTVQRVPITLALTLLLVAMVMVRTQASYPGLTNIDPIAYKHMRVWSARVFTDDATWMSYKALRQDSSQTQLLPFYRFRENPSLVSPNGIFNLVARKPQFIANTAHHYLSVDKWGEAFQRRLVAQKLTHLLNSKEPIARKVIGEVADRRVGKIYVINQTFEEYFHQRGVNIFVPAEKEALFPPELPRARFGQYMLISFAKTT